GQQDGTAPGVAEALAAFRRPQPPVAAGARAAVCGATAMMDVSDGLLRDAGRMARASGVHLDLDPDALAEDVAALAAVAEQRGADPLAWVLTGGADHGLLATFPAGAPLPAPFREIGRASCRERVARSGGAGTLQKKRDEKSRSRRQ